MLTIIKHRVLPWKVLAVLAGVLVMSAQTPAAEVLPEFLDDQAIGIAKGGIGLLGALAEEGPKKLDKIGTDPIVMETARAIVAIGEFGTTPAALTFLEKIQNDTLLGQVHYSDWIMFPDEYRHSMRRIGEVRMIGTLKTAGESDIEAYLGTRFPHTLQDLVKAAIERLKHRNEKK